MIELLREMRKYRALISALVVRHLSSRYRGSSLGFLWSLLNPLCLMGVYTLVFHYYMRFAGVENYTLFLFCGLLPWIWFSSGLIEGTSAITSSGHLITKSLFPAHILPLVANLTSLVHFVLSLPLLFIFMLAAGVTVPKTALFFPVLMILQLIFLNGIVLACSALNVLYRDVQHLVGNLLSLLFFLCPVIYPISSVPSRFHFTFHFNPFALFVMSYQDILLHGVLPTTSRLAALAAWSLLSLLAGTMVFRRYRETFAELL